MSRQSPSPSMGEGLGWGCVPWRRRGRRRRLWRPIAVFARPLVRTPPTLPFPHRGGRVLVGRRRRPLGPPQPGRAQRTAVALGLHQPLAIFLLAPFAILILASRARLRNHPRLQLVAQPLGRARQRVRPHPPSLLAALARLILIQQALAQPHVQRRGQPHRPRRPRKTLLGRLSNLPAGLGRNNRLPPQRLGQLHGQIGQLLQRRHMLRHPRAMSVARGVGGGV